MVDFNNVLTDDYDYVTNVFENKLEPWSKVFEFPLKVEPTVEEMKGQPYKGLEGKNLLFEFSGSLWRLRRQVTTHKNLKFTQGNIKVYPNYIYSQLKYDSKLTDKIILQALDELDAIITKGDMNFVEANNYRGNSYKFDTPFYLSFLKSQVFIYFVDDTTIASATTLDGAIAVQRFGVYCPYYKIVDQYYPVILLSLKALKYQAKMNKLNISDLFQHILLELFAYAFQDPTNKIDEEGIFVKPTYDIPSKEIKSITYDRQAAEEFVNSYLNLSH